MLLKIKDKYRLEFSVDYLLEYRFAKSEIRTMKSNSYFDLLIRTINDTDYCASLATGQSRTGARSGTTYNTDHGGDL